MTSLTFQNFIFFLGSGVWTPPDPIKFKCIHILEILECLEIHMCGVMYDSYLLKDVHSVLVNFPREYAQESMMLYI